MLLRWWWHRAAGLLLKLPWRRLPDRSSRQRGALHSGSALRARHGGGRHRVELSDHPAADPDDRLLALDEALSRLAAEDPEAAKVVELRHFAGLGHEGVAAALGVSVYEARQKWAYARAWLRDALAE